MLCWRVFGDGDIGPGRIRRTTIVIRIAGAIVRTTEAIERPPNSGPTGGERRAVASRPVDMSRYASVNATKTATR